MFGAWGGRVMGRAWMPDEGTAEFEGQGNADPESFAPPLEETETAADDGATESAGTEGETDTADPFASLDEEAIRDHPRIKELLEATTRDVEARKEESARQRIQTAQATALAERHSAERQYQASDKFIEQFEGLVRGAATDANGDPVIDRDALKQLNGINIRTGADIPVSAMANLMGETVGEGFTQTAAERDEQTAAYSHFHQTLDPQPLFRHWLAVAQRAMTDQARESIRAEVEVEVRRDEAAKAEAAKAELAAKGRQGAQPTTVPGAPVRTGGPANEFDALNQKLTAGSIADGMKALRELGVSV